MEKHLHWLGWRVKDKVSGFTGVCETIGIDLYGCIQGIVGPPVVTDKDGVQKKETGHWFDLTRLEKVGTEPVMQRIEPRKDDAPGGYDKPTR